MTISMHLLAEYAGAWMLFMLASRNVWRCIVRFEGGDDISFWMLPRILVSLVLCFALATHAGHYTEWVP